mgnify:CR=1 FL=1
MFNKIKKRNDHRKIFFDREFESFFRFINKYSTRQFAVMAVIVATAVICTFEGFEYIYRQSVITRQTAVIQNEAVLIAAEYSNYESLEAAENNDMNSRLSSYSALNQIRIIMLSVLTHILLILIRQFLIPGYSIYSVIIRTVPAMIRKRVIYRQLFRYTMIQVHL